MNNGTDLRLERAKYERKVLDSWTCCNCGYSKNVPFLNREVHAHHTYDASTYKRDKYKVKYLRTLCGVCHINRFHGSWMGSTRKSCTIWDYYKWRLYEEVVWFAWLRRLIGKIFK